MLLKIGDVTVKVTDLITSGSIEIIKELGKFLVEAENTRKKVKEPRKVKKGIGFTPKAKKLSPIVPPKTED